MAKKRGNGEGTIYYKESKKIWTAQVSTGYDTNGRTKRVTIYGKTRKEVADKMNTILSKVNEKRFIDKTTITLGEILSELQEDKYKSNLIGDRTFLRNKGNIKIISKSNIKLLEKPIQNIKEKDIKEFLFTIVEYSDSVIGKIFAMLNSGFKNAVRQKYIIDNPMEFLKKPKSIKSVKKVEALTIEEQQKLLSILDINKQYDQVILIMLYSGLRIGEVLAISIDEIDLSNNILYINKSLTRDLEDKAILGKTTKTYSSIRQIAINKILKIIINKIILNYTKNEDKLMFWNVAENKIITPIEINSYLKRISKKYNITEHIHNHMLRHTYATRCIEAGMSAVVLQKKLGHKDVSITLNTYTSVFSKFEDTQDEKLEKYLNNSGLQYYCSTI